MPVLTKENEDAVRAIMKEVAGAVVADAIKENMAQFRESLIPPGSTSTDAIIRAPVTQPVIPNSPEELLRDGGIATKLKSAEAVTRMVRAIAASKGDHDRAAAWYRDVYKNEDDEVYKALAATNAAAGGFMVPEQMAMDVIELLRPASKFRTMGPVIEGMDTGVMRVSRITSGSSATYIAENANMTATQPTFGQVVASAKKLAALVPISNDLIRRKTSSSTIIRDDLISALAQTSDLAFIRSDGTNGEPTGMRWWSAAANRLTMTNNGSAVTENVLADLGRMVQTLMEANARMLNVGWMMAPRTWTALLTMTSSTGQTILRDEVVAGRLMGFPFAVSNQIPTNLAVTGSGDSELYLTDFADMVIAEQEGLILDASTEAAYHDGSSVVAAYSQDQTVIRAIMEHDLVSRHEETIIVLTDVDWAAGITT